MPLNSYDDTCDKPFIASCDQSAFGSAIYKPRYPDVNRPIVDAANNNIKNGKDLLLSDSADFTQCGSYIYDVENDANACVKSVVSSSIDGVNLYDTTPIVYKNGACTYDMEDKQDTLLSGKNTFCDVISCKNDTVVGPPVAVCSNNFWDEKFKTIRNWCKTDAPLSRAVGDISPDFFAPHRLEYWPFTTGGFKGNPISKIYETVRSTGLPNVRAARIPVPSELHIDTWERYLKHDDNAGDLIDLLTFGFPLGYLGPVSNTLHLDNHSTSLRFPKQVENYIAKESTCSAMYGPFADSLSLP